METGDIRSQPVYRILDGTQSVYRIHVDPGGVSEQPVVFYDNRKSFILLDILVEKRFGYMEHGCVFEEKVGCKANDKQIGMVTKENEESGLSKKVYQLAGRNRTVLGPADEGSMCPADKNSKCSGFPLRMMAMPSSIFIG